MGAPGMNLSTVAATLTGLYRYPVKGLSAEPLERAELETGKCFPGDRLFAVENGPSGFDPLAPQHLPKIRYLMLARNGALARLKTRFDAVRRELSITGPGGDAVTASLDTPAGRAEIADFLADFVASDLRGPPRVLSAAGYQFMDSQKGFVSLINNASLTALEKLTGRPVEPLRFRANLYVDGLEPWQEFDLIGQHLALGTARFEVLKRIDRCAATHVNPASGERDIDMVGTLERAFGHHDCGIYLKVAQGGAIAINDRLSVLNTRIGG